MSLAERSNSRAAGGSGSTTPLNTLSDVKVRPLQVALTVERDDTATTDDDDDTDASETMLDSSKRDTAPLLATWSPALDPAHTRERKKRPNSASAAHLPLRTRFLQSWRRTKALRYIAFSALHFSLMSACVKYASRRVTSHETAFWRTAIAWLLNYAMIRYYGVSLAVAPKHRRALLLRSIVGTLGISLKFYAMSKMVLTDAVVIIFTSPVQTFLLGALVLGEAVNRVDFASGVLSYVGVLFVTRPTFLFPAETQSKDATTLAILCAHGGAFMQACCYICMRTLQEVNCMVTIHYFLLFGMGFSLLTLATLSVPLQLSLPVDTMLALFGSGFFAFIGHIFLTKGFQREKAGVASVMRYFDVVFVLLWDTTILGEHVSGYSIFGGAIILLGAALIVVRRAHATK